MRLQLIVLGGLLLTAPVLAEVSDFTFGRLQNAYGTYDYRSDKDNSPIVEGAHFTHEVSSLLRADSGYLGGDIDYTLRAIPNHHHALMGIIRLCEKEHRAQPGGANYTVECYLYRANWFRSDDPMVKMIFATYLAKHRRSNEALNYLNEAVALGEKNANSYYNIALIYLDLKRHETALAYAHKAYKPGFP